MEWKSVVRLIGRFETLVKIANGLSLSPWLILLKVGVLTFTELDFRQFVYFTGNVSGKLNMNSNNE